MANYDLSPELEAEVKRKLGLVSEPEVKTILSTETAQQQQNNLKSSLSQAAMLGMSPEQVASDAKLSKKSGIPYSMITEKSRQEIEKGMSIKASMLPDYTEKGGAATAIPATYEFLKNPANYAMVMSTAPAMAENESIFKRVSSGWKQQSMQQDATETGMDIIFNGFNKDNRALFERQNKDMREYALTQNSEDIWYGLGVGGRQQAQNLAGYAKGAGIAGAALLVDLALFGVSIGSEGTALPATVPAATAITTKAAYDIVSIFGKASAAYEGFKMETAGSLMDLYELKDANGRQMPENVMRQAAVVAGLAKSGLEYAEFETWLTGLPGGGKLLNKITKSAGGKSAIKEFISATKEYGKTLGLEITQEEAQQSVDFAVRQAAMAYANKYHGTNFKLDGSAELLNEGKETAIGSFYQFALLMLPGPYMKAAGNSYANMVNKQRQVHNAKGLQTIQSQLNTAAKDIELCKRMPDRAVEFMGTMNEKLNNPYRSVFVPAAEVQKYFNDNKLKKERQTELVSIMGVNEADIASSAALNTDIEIPSERFAVLTANEEALGNTLMNTAKAEADGVALSDIQKEEGAVAKFNSDYIRYVVGMNFADQTRREVEAFEAGDSEAKDVYVSASAVETLFQNSDKGDVLNALGIAEKSFDDALASGNDLKIDADKLRNNSPMVASLRSELKFEEDGVSLAEAMNFQLNDDAEWKAGGSWFEHTQKAISAVDSARRVASNLKAQMLLSGMQDDVADKTAEVYANHILRSANRLKISPEEYAKQYAPLKIVRGTGQDAGKLFLQPMNSNVNLNSRVSVVKLDNVLPGFESRKASKAELVEFLNKLVPVSVNTADGNVLKIAKENVNHIADGVYYKVINPRTQSTMIRNVADLAEHAVLIETVENKKVTTNFEGLSENKKNRAIKKNKQEVFHYFYVPAQIGNKLYTVKLVAFQDGNEVKFAPKESQIYDVITTKEVGTHGDIPKNSVITFNGANEVTIADMLKNVKGSDGEFYLQSVGHVSKAVFDRFDHSFMGSGEGAQAYGWGSYFASNDKVLDYYRKQFKPGVFEKDLQDGVCYITLNGEKLDLKKLANEISYDILISDIEKTFKDEVRHISNWHDFNKDRFTRNVKYLIEQTINKEKSAIKDAERWEKDESKVQELKNKTEKELIILNDLKRFFEKPDDISFAHKDYSNFEDYINNIRAHEYEVDIPDVNSENYLNLDKPMANSKRIIKRIYDGLLQKGAIIEDVSFDDFFDSIYKNASYFYNRKPTLRNVYDHVSDMLGSPKAASQFLDSIGIIGNMYLDGNSRGDGKGSYNFVIFNEDNARIIQRLYQEQGAADSIRGAISLPVSGFGNGAPITINITKNANASTAIHELGHFFLWEQFNLAAMLPNDAQLQEDMQTIREWLGMGEEQAEISVEQHEKFARGFEAYLREGKAPSVELMSAFQRFKSWLCEIYRTLTELDVELSDDMRAVFDRMLASEEQIEAAAMTDTESESALAGIVTEQAETLRREQGMRARAKALAKSLGVYDKAKKAKDKHSSVIRERVASEVADMPVYRAMKFMRASDKNKLSAPQLVTDYGTDVIQDIIAQIPQDLIVGQGGLSAEQVAGMFGYDNGAVFLESLKNAPEMEQEITARTEAAFLDAEEDPVSYISQIVDDEMYDEASLLPIVMERESLNDLSAFSSDELDYLEEEKALLEDKENSPVSRKNLLKWLKERNTKISFEQIKQDFAEDADFLKKSIGSSYFSENGAGLDEIAQEMEAEGIPVGSGDSLFNLLSTVEIETKEEKRSRQEKIRSIKERIRELNKNIAAEDKAGQRAAREQARIGFALDRMEQKAEYKRKREELQERAKLTADSVAIAARDQINRIGFSAVSGKAQIYRSAEMQARREFSEAMKERDYTRAKNAKDREILFHALTAEARKAVKEVKQIQDKTERVRERSRKDTAWIPQEYMAQIDRLMLQFGIEPGGSPSAYNSVVSLDSFCSSLEQDCIPCPVSRSIRTGNLDVRRQGRTTYDLSVGELRDYKTALDWLVHTGRESKRLSDFFARRDVATAAFELGEHIRKNTDKLIAERRMNTNNMTFDESPKERLLRSVSEFMNSATKIEAWCEIVDDFQPLGMMQQMIFQPIANAQDKETSLQRIYSNKFGDLLNKTYSVEEQRKLTKKQLFPLVNKALSKEEVIMHALNMGNETNLERVLTGNQWTKHQLDSVVSSLDKKDWEFVQSVWDMLDEFWPDIAKLQRDITGYIPERVQAKPFTANYKGREPYKHGVKMRGGYFPIAYNRLAKNNRNIRNLTEKQAVEDLFETQYAYAATRHGHTEARVRSTGYELQYSFSVIQQHINNVIHDLAFRKTIIDVNKLLRFNTILEDMYGAKTRVAPVQDALISAFGEDMYNQFQPWLQAMARNENNMNDISNHVIFKWFKKGAQVSTLGYKATTWISQLFGFPVAMSKVGSVPLVRNIWSFYKNPFLLKEKAEFVWEKSEFMRSRNQSGGMDKDIAEYLADIKEGSRLAGFKRSMFYMTRAFDTGVTIPIWLTAYEQGMMEHKFDETKAIQYADSVVRTTQDIGTKKDLSAIQRNHKFLTMYYNAGNTQFNIALKEYYKMKMHPEEKAKILGNMLYVFAIPALLAALIKADVPDFGDDDDDTSAIEKGYIWFKWGASRVLAQPFNTVPIIRDMVTAVNSGFNYSGSPVFDGISRFILASKRLGSNVSDWVEGEDVNGRQMFNDSLTLSGYLFQLPAGQMRITVNALLDYLYTDKEVGVTDFFLYRKR